MYEYWARVLSVTESTIKLEVDLGFDVKVGIEGRFWGINAPETKQSDSQDLMAGMRSKAFIDEWIKAADYWVVIKSHDENHSEGARWTVSIFDGEGPQAGELGPALIAAGHYEPHEFQLEAKRTSVLSDITAKAATLPQDKRDELVLKLQQMT